MGLLEKETQELRELLQRYMAGELTHEKLTGACSVYARTEKRAALHLQALSLAAKHGKVSVKKELESSQFFGNGGSYLAIAESECEKLLCPEAQKHITRRECLDYSGQNQDGCEGCKNFVATRNIILGDKQ